MKHVSGESRRISLTKLKADPLNPRLGSRRSADLTHEQSMRFLIERNPAEIVNLTIDISVHGTDPGNLPIVIPDKDGKSFLLMDGNRRLTALNLLKSPNFAASSGLSEKSLRKVDQARSNWAGVDSLDVVVYPSRKETRIWLERRHRGKSKGIGASSWDSEEQQRFDRDGDGGYYPALDIKDWMGLGGEQLDPSGWSTFDRFLKSTPGREILALGSSNDATTTTLYGKDFFALMAQVFRQINDGSWNTRTLNTAEMTRHRISADISTSLINPSHRRNEPIVLAHLGLGDSHDSEERLYDEANLETVTSDDGAGQTFSTNPAALTQADRHSAIEKAPPFDPTPKSPHTTENQIEIELFSTVTERPTASARSSKIPTNVIPSASKIPIYERKTKAVYEELKKLNASTFPTIGTMGLRVLIEDTVYFYLQHDTELSSSLFDGKNSNKDDSLNLKRKVNAIAQSLSKKLGEEEIKLNRKQLETIQQMDIVLPLNQTAHNPHMSRTGDDAREIWKIIEPLIRLCWNQINHAQPQSP